MHQGNWPQEGIPLKLTFTWPFCKRCIAKKTNMFKVNVLYQT